MYACMYVGYRMATKWLKTSKHEEMERWLLRAHITLPEDQGSTPSKHVRWLTITCNSSFRRSNTSTGTHTHVECTVKNKINLK